MVIDSHIHLTNTEIEAACSLLKNGQVAFLANAASVDEWHRLEALKFSGDMYISFGIHPWDVAERGIDEELEGYFKKCDAIGEIGMDSVWCGCDLRLQREIFIKQLDVAERLRKPVVLHTKGEEKEIAEVIKNYSMNKLVHWYSCESYLEEYIKQGCYFSVGPDFKINEAVMNVINKVPAEKLLVETDGMEAVLWAINRKCNLTDTYELLTAAICAIATAKNISYADMKNMMVCNFKKFLQAE